MKKEAAVVNIKDVKPVTISDSVRVRRLITKKSIGSDKLMLGVVFVDPSKEFIEWTYEVEDEVYYVVKSQVTIYCNDRRIVVKEGDAIYLPAWEKHKLINEGVEPAVIMYAISPPIE